MGTCPPPLRTMCVAWLPGRRNRRIGIQRKRCRFNETAQGDSQLHGLPELIAAGDRKAKSLGDRKAQTVTERQTRIASRRSCAA